MAAPVPGGHLPARETWNGLLYYRAPGRGPFAESPLETVVAVTINYVKAARTHAQPLRVSAPAWVRQLAPKQKRCLMRELRSSFKAATGRALWFEIMAKGGKVETFNALLLAGEEKDGV